MPLSMPATVKSQGFTTLIVLTTPPAVPSAPTKAELNAGEFITCHIYGEFGATPSQNVGSSPRKMCSRVEPQQLGNVTYSINDIQYSYNPQEAASPGGDGNEAFDALAEDVDQQPGRRLQHAQPNAPVPVPELEPPFQALVMGAWVGGRVAQQLADRSFQLPQAYRLLLK